jgi:isoleucyl-tRNA synthetase
MTYVMGPILPHLAEEILFTRQGGEDRQAGLSVFTRQWEDMVRRMQHVCGLALTED